MRSTVLFVLLGSATFASFEGCNRSTRTDGRGLIADNVYVMLDAARSKDIVTDHVELISYSVPRMGDVHVLFGPNPGEPSAKALVSASGDFYLTTGFAYMWAPVTYSTGGISSMPMDSPRPYIRTTRVNATGKGCAWAVQVLTNEDRIYFAEGGSILVFDPQTAALLIELNTPRTFASYSSGTSIGQNGPYQNDQAARDFTFFIDTYRPNYGMPAMN